MKKIAEEGGGLVLREFRVVHLLLEDAKLRDFIAQNLEELSQKGFNVTAICNVQISYLHKLTILKTLIDRDISDQEVIETFTKYYGIDPAILEHFGYEHISKLADLCMPLIECRTSSIDLERTIPLIKRAMDGDITSERMSSLSTLYSLAHPELIAEFGEEKLLQIKSSMFYRALAKDSEVELSIQKDLIQRTLDGQLTEQMLTNLMQMHKLILNAFGIDALIPYCLKEYLPMLMYTDHQLSIEERIGIIRQVLGSDIENKEAFLCHAGNIDLAILTHFTLEKLMPLLNQLYTPNVLNSWSTELTTDQKIKLIDEVMTDTPEDKIFTTLNTLGSLHPAIITSFPLEILKSFIGQYGNMPSILCGGEEPLEQTIELVKTTLEREPQDAKEILFKLSSIDSKIVTALGEKLLPLCKNHYIPNVLGVFDSSITPEAKLALMEMLITKDLGENMVHVLRNIDNLATKYSVENISKILDAIKTLPPLYVHPTLYQMSQADTTILETITIEDMVRLCTTNTSNTAKLPSADIVFKALQPHSDLPEHVEVNYNTKISIDDTVHIAQSITFHQLGELVTNINLLGFYKNTESLNCYYDGNHYHIQSIGQDDITIEHI